MLILPAIDLLGGEAVRLYKGDYQQKTVYGNPLEIAEKFKAMGAKFLHVVDLDGAKNGNPCNHEIIRQISEILPIQIGGGIRTAATVEEYLKIANRVILGTIAVQKPEFVREMIEKHGPERIVVGVDVRNGKVSTSGWLEDSQLNYLEFIEQLKQIGVQYIVATDITKDGTLTSPNWEMYEKIRGINVVVSGGISCNEDVKKAGKYYGVIVGKAYYEGKVNLEELL